MDQTKERRNLLLRKNGRYKEERGGGGGVKFNKKDNSQIKISVIQSLSISITILIFFKLNSIQSWFEPWLLYHLKRYLVRKRSWGCVDVILSYIAFLYDVFEPQWYNLNLCLFKDKWDFFCFLQQKISYFKLWFLFKVTGWDNEGNCQNSSCCSLRRIE